MRPSPHHADDCTMAGGLQASGRDTSSASDRPPIPHSTSGCAPGATMAIASGASACPMLAAECWKPSFTPEGAPPLLLQKLVTNRRAAGLHPAATMIDRESVV